MNVYRKLILDIKKNKISNQRDLNKLKTEYARKYHIGIPSNTELLNHVSEKERISMKNILTMKPVRTQSGVAPVAIMTKPHKCPHGKCIFCPGGVKSEFGCVPQSYTGKEPATRRAIRNDYDPYLQVMNRLEHYIIMNQNPEKIELIVMGGTFLALSKKYRDDFVMYSFKAMNDFSKNFYKNNKLDIKKFEEFFELKVDRNDEERISRIQNRLLKMKKSSSLESEQRKNEKSKIKCVSLVIETRPDVCGKKEINELLRLGCTKVELGVQSVYEGAIKKAGRGHIVKDSIKATKLLKDAGFKITYHMMPGLPGVSLKDDLNGLKEIIFNEYFKPDMLKIYPCMVMKGTKLYSMKKFKPLTTKKAIILISKFKTFIPEYMRVMRVQRDIPSFVVEKGVDKTNLRQYITEFMKKNDMKCRCIRCREIKNEKIGKIKYKIFSYEASEGVEFFISAESNDKIVGFCRLRFDDQNVFIRELHVYGTSTSLKEKGKTQHKGIGKKLMNIAEDLCKRSGVKKLFVISGVGVRDYYRKLGYKKEKTYMVKKL